MQFAELADRLKRAGSHAEYLRIQCVLIRATPGSSTAPFAQLLGWSTAAVHMLHSRRAKEGDAIFDLRGRGGRRHQSPQWATADPPSNNQPLHHGTRRLSCTPVDPPAERAKLRSNTSATNLS